MTAHDAEEVSGRGSRDQCVGDLTPPIYLYYSLNKTVLSASLFQQRFHAVTGKRSYAGF